VIQGGHRAEEQHLEQTAEALPQLDLRPQARTYLAGLWCKISIAYKI